MNLSEPFIRRPVMTTLVMAALLFFGVAAFKFLPVSDLPNIDLPTIEISVGYPGANPETMGNSIATPLEQACMGIEGLQSVFSSSSTGSTSIVLQFSLDRDINDATIDVQAAITRTIPDLPSNLPSNPTYSKINPASTPILYLALVAENMPLSELYDYANKFIAERLTMIEGVSNVITYGSPYAVRIQVDPEKLAAKNISLDEINNAIRQNNVSLPVGTLYGKGNNVILDVDGQMTRASQYAELVVKNAGGDLVKIKEIGRAIDSVKNDKFSTRYITKESNDQTIILGVQRLPGTNTVKIANNIKARLETLRPQLPAAMKIFTIYDQSESILEGVHDVEFTLLVAFFLVVTVIYLSLGKGMNTLIPSLSLPLCIFGTFSVMYLLGYSVDILSLLALTLSVGFLVDDAIVVLENNVRHAQLGEAPFTASLKGSKEISTTVLSMTLCLVAAFIPLLFMGGVVGELFREFAVTLIVAVLISGFISLTLIPMLSSRFIKPYSIDQKTKMEQLADRLNEKMKRIYEPCLKWSLTHRFVILSVGMISVFGSFFLFTAVKKDFLPPEDVGFIQGFTLAQDGTSPDRMNQYQMKLDEIGIQDPNVESIISISSYSASSQGVIFYRLQPFKKRKPIFDVIGELSAKLQKIPGVNAYLSPLPLINLQTGTTGMAPYQYSLSSLDRNALYAYAPKLTAKMRNNPNFSQVSSDLRINQPQLNLHVNREKAANYDIDVAAIENYLQYAYSDNKASQINTDISQYDVILETLPEFYRDPTVLSKLYIRSTTDALVPLSEIVEMEETVGPLTVNHTNGLPSVGISFDLGKEVTLGTALEELKKITADDMPAMVFGQTIGTADVFQSSFNSLSFLLLLSFFVIYVVLGILYESFIHPLTVMSTLPPALLGGLLTLYLFGESLSIYSFVGLILLVGIVLKNGIMMVDFAIVAVEQEKKAPLDAITEAALARFRPIFMTTVCAMMGALPIALGIGGPVAQSRISLGLCIVGGLAISQLLTLLLTPVLYYYFEILQERLMKKNGEKH